MSVGGGAGIAAAGGAGVWMSLELDYPPVCRISQLWGLLWDLMHLAHATAM